MMVLKKIWYLCYLYFTESYSQLSVWKENSFCSKDFVVTVSNSLKEIVNITLLELTISDRDS